MDHIIGDMIIKQLYNEQSRKYENKKSKDRLLCNFCRVYYNRSGRTCHERGQRHIEKVSEFRAKLSNFIKKEVYSDDKL